MSERPFHFRLKRIHELREDAETREQEELARSMARRAGGQSAVDTAGELLDQAAVDQRDAISAATSGEALLATQLWRERLEQHRDRAGRELEQLDDAVVAQRHRLVNAHRARRVLDTLHDAGLAAHRTGQARRSAATTDEIAIQQHRRTQGSR